jgi:hypothetical protein
MTEVDALLRIANAITGLAVAVGWVGVVLWLMLLYKDMGRGSDIAQKLRKRDIP